MADARTAGSLFSASKTLAGSIALVVLFWLVQPYLREFADHVMIASLWSDLGPIRKVALFLIAGIVTTSLGLPRQSVALFGGFLFGATIGTLLALAATLGGCVLAYHVASGLRATLVRRHLPRMLGSLEAWTRDRVFEKTLMLRLMPVGSNLATNVTAGIVRAPRVPFFAASLLGFLPQTLVFVFGGASVSTGSTWSLAIGAGMLAISLAIGIRLYTARHSGNGDDGG